MKEIVPRRAIAAVARLRYDEPYQAMPMRHRVEHDPWRVWQVQVAELGCDVAASAGVTPCARLATPARVALDPVHACYDCYGGIMARTIPHRELRNHSSDVLRRVQAGETIQVTNHGEVVAVLSPPGRGLAPRIVAAKHRGGFAAIPRVRSAETTQQALDALRDE